jgi:hypothetical protein
MSKPFNFIDLDLQGGAYTTVNSGIDNTPPTKQKTVDIARGDGEVSMFLGYGSRAWEHSGTIRADSSDALEQAIDAIKRYNHRKGTYFYGYAGGTRYIEAVLRNIIISRAPTDLSRAGYSAEFYAEDPFITNGETGTLVNETGVTDADITFSVNVEGTYLAAPIYQITYTDIDPDDTEVEIILTNNSENHSLIINHIIQAGDVLTINSIEETVFLNGTIILADGLFPLFAPETGSLKYQDNATTREFDILGTYEKRFL